MPTLKHFDVSNFDLVICGAGFFGLTVAQLYADTFAGNVLVVERRGHPGGNAWSAVDPVTNIEMHLYGSHLFHTSNERVWNFINRFSDFVNYEHKVITRHKNRFFNFPINLQTLSQFYGRDFTPSQARALLENFALEVENPGSFEDAAIKQVGRELYEAFYQSYTQKQWQTSPKDLPAEIFKRIPIRFNFDHRYFDDKYQVLPKDGYFKLFLNMLRHDRIFLALNTDFHDLKHRLAQNQVVVYTGAVDEFFDYKFGSLGWRTLDFEIEHKDIEDFQGTSVINYADLDVPFTRIHEFKHLHPERIHTPDKTVIMREYSRAANRHDEPYYPINTQKNRKVLLQYREMSKKMENVFFGGRLGSFQYLDMHMAIASAMTVFENEIRPSCIRLRN